MYNNTYMYMYTVFADSDSEPEDNVRLWEQGWKERYYNKKFVMTMSLSAA